jgi:GT2 family glycosyltransferase
MADKFFVTAVVVTHDGATWLPKVIAALGSQSRSIERIVAVDTGSTDNSVKLLKASGITHFIEDRELGYGDAIDHALELTPATSDDEWIWLIHDDCAPDKSALANLLAAIENRPQVAVAGPKLRGWYDREHLLEVGVSIATNGARWTGLERREQDQGQHDGVREVLAVSTAGALIKRSVYEELGGLDTNLALFRDDVDFGWRAYVAGYSVIAVPEALAFHAEASSSERRAVDVSEAFLHRPLLLDRRNAAYVMLVNASWWMLPGIAIQLLAAGVGRAFLNLLAKLPGYAADEIAAVGLLLINPKELIQARKFRKKKRLISPRIIKRFIPPRWSQVRMASERVMEMITNAIRPNAELATFAESQSYSDIGVIGDSFDDPDLVPVKQDSLVKALLKKPHVIVFLAISLISLIAARERLSNISGGSLGLSPSSGLDLVNQYAQSWHLVGLGSAATTPPWVPVLGLMSVVTGFNLAAFVTLLFLVAPIVIFYIFYRVLTKLGSSRYYALIGAGIYGFSPVVWASINQGRIGTLMVILIAPALYFIAPFTRENERATWRRIFAITLLIAALCIFNPMILAAWLVMQGFLLIVNAIELRHLFREAGLRELIVAPQSGAIKRRFALLVTPWILTAPWSVSMLLHPTQFFIEPGIPVASGSRWSEFLANPGGAGAPPLWLLSPVLFFAMAALAIKELRNSSFVATAVIALAIALSSFTISGHGSVANIWTGPIIAIASALLIPSVLIFAEKLIPTLKNNSLGIQHAITGVIAAVTVFSLVATPIWAMTGGSQSLVRSNAPQIVPAFVTALADTPSKPKALVINEINGEILYAISRGNDIQIGDADVTIAPPREVVTAVTDLVSGSGISSAKTLGAFGIQYVFLKAIQDGVLVRTIDGSGGFARMSSTKDGIVWKVLGAAPRVIFTAPNYHQIISSTDVSAEADVPMPGTIRVAEKFDTNWRLLLDGKRVPLTKSSDGLPTFQIPQAGHITLSHDSTLHRGLLSLQLIALITVVVLALPGGRRRREVPIEELV